MLEGENIIWVTKSLWAFYIYVYIYIYMYRWMILSNRNVFFTCFFRQNDVAFAPHPSKFGKHKVWQPRVGKNLNWSKFHRAEVWGRGLGPCQDDTPFAPFFLWRWVFWIEKKGGGTRFCSPKIWRKVPRFKHMKALKSIGWKGETFPFWGPGIFSGGGIDRWYTQLLFMAIF